MLLANRYAFYSQRVKPMKHPQARALLENFETDFVLADKAYDAEHILQYIDSLDAQAVIPPKANRKERRAYDKVLYKERNLIERFIGKLKHFRRCFSRFDKLARNYLSFLYFASTLIWLRGNVNTT